MKQYGLVSPGYGVRRDVPSMRLPSAYSRDSVNILIRDGELRAAPGPEVDVSAAVPDGRTILAMHFYKKDEGYGYLLAFTDSHVYVWRSATASWGLLYTCLSVCSQWSIVTFNNLCFATNAKDRVIYWNGEGTFQNLGDEVGILFAKPYFDDGGTKQRLAPQYITRCRRIAAFENYLMLIGPTLGGTEYPFDIAWSAIGDHTNFSEGDSGIASVPGADPIVAGGLVNDFFIIIKEQSIYRWWATGGDGVFNLSLIQEGIGTLSPQSLINLPDGRLAFLGADKRIRAVTGTPGDVAIISDEVSDWLREIPDASRSKVAALRILGEKLTAWSIPYGAEQTTNNRTLILSDEGQWGRLDIGALAFSAWDAEEQWTIDTIPYSTIDTIAWTTLDNDKAPNGLLYPIYAGSDGKIYRLLATPGGQAATLILSVDMANGGDPDAYKRLQRIRGFFRGESAGSVTLSVRGDGQADWTSWGTMNLTSTAETTLQELTGDKRARYFEIKLEGSVFRLIGLMLEYVDSGRR
jgi:hypothetical protein